MRIVIFALSLVVSTAAIANDKDKGAYQIAMHDISPINSVYGFMLDQYLELKCGKPQSIEVFKYDTKTFLEINIKLSEGQFTQAKQLLAVVPCNNAK